MSENSRTLNREFRDRLIKSDSTLDRTSEELVMQMQDLYVRRLSTRRRAFLVAVSVGALAMTLVCGLLAMTEPQLPGAVRGAFVVGCLIGTSWLAYAVRLLKRGETDSRFDNRTAAIMAWGFTFAMVLFFLAVAAGMPDRQKGTLLAVQGIPFLIAASVYWLSHKINATQLATREQLLRIELRLSRES